MLAKAVARSSGCTFWNCSAATIVSKYRGDSEKTIRCLFDAARAAAPSIVFIDEIDGIARGRNSASGADGEHEASRRLKIELLVQMDGLLEEQPILHTTLPGVAERTASQRVLVLGASNCPWDLDDALLRRFEKRIFIPLPAKDARKDIFMLYLAQMQLENNMDVPGAEYNAVLLHSLRSSWAERLAEHTEGYSGSDIASVCKEAAMGPVRRMMANLAAGALPPQQWNPSTITLSPVGPDPRESVVMVCVGVPIGLSNGFGKYKAKRIKSNCHDSTLPRVG